MKKFLNKIIKYLKLTNKEYESKPYNYKGDFSYDKKSLPKDWSNVGNDLSKYIK